MEIKGLTSLELSIVFYLMFSIFDVRILVVRAEQLALNSQVITSAPNVTISFIPRSCHEAWKSGHPDLKQSGMYWIDPDGQGIGKTPIYVHCNMDNGETSVLHDTENELAIPVSPGFYDRNIAYLNATTSQLIALASISQSCYQTIAVNCLRAPFQPGSGNNLQSYSWWRDRSNTNQSFWSGDGTAGHTCQCGLDNNCIDNSYKCNCDANVAIPLTDAGRITNKAMLPVMGLRFGYAKHEGSSYKLGRLVCKGADLSVTENGRKPQTCADLWRIGHTLDGFYLFHRDDVGQPPSFGVSYCNFKDVDSATVPETPIGTIVGNP